MAKEMTNDSSQNRLDYGIILSVMLLALIGLGAIYMATVHDGSTSPVRAVIMQVMWYVIGGVGIFIVLQFDAEQLWRLAPILYGIGIFLLLAVLVLYDRQVAASTGAKSWFRLGPITFQPSEVMKPAYILMLGRVVTQHNTKFKHTTHNDWVLIGRMLLWTLPVAALMMLQNDFGTTLVFLAIFVGVILVSGITWKILVPIAGVGAAIGGMAILLVTQTWGRTILAKIGFKAYQFARIDSWLNPSGATSGDSFQLWQSMKAIGSGQMTGKGFNHLEVVVPVQESDMIFSVIGEAFGFIGSAAVILLYFLLIYQMIRVIFDTKNEFYAYITSGVVMMIVFHVFENIGMNIGLLPLTGIPLPFISQGGSFLLANMLSVGMVLSMRYHHTSYMFSQEQESF
ncbi:cell division membrane protein rod shape-determining protein RodA [Lacticaseibacillus brantae DSM 23927]|uniref:Cell division membrane protein rod shape-determining protein RodA n=2 Tax=Lacticaseibacillus brantae TaxID=943673 RepID=A0A0R2B9T7_9LACO|nr:cell division membrane protein rod shape-determining protein RodA [Lacticaseibacillus brantae DSM 23927]